jgi:phenylalanyl-tRNA synthetase beta chain
MIEQVMEKTGSVGFQDAHELKKGKNKVQNFKLVADNSDPRWMPGRGASIVLNGRTIGHMGVLHPEVLDHFELKYPVTCFELDFDTVFGQFTEKDFQDQEFINSLYSHKFM